MGVIPLVLGLSPRVMVDDCCREHALFGLVGVSAFTSLYVSFDLVIVYRLISLRQRTPSRL